eukprot:CAMPEP_0119366536 /NCGR_PEP_ID=MMETSP1334-20130426/13405_1 /TAXON_ID=127549 /ORGANISM="Calcidiscus leptoporus, Strain RCC1130" /LENGTH=139 /DNA_ID=CAMNT_0007382769 /DNA_START=290 /DNA_END=709 /DNA_ORIENTATION=+
MKPQFTSTASHLPTLITVPSSPSMPHSRELCFTARRGYIRFACSRMSLFWKKAAASALADASKAIAPTSSQSESSVEPSRACTEAVLPPLRRELYLAHCFLADSGVAFFRPFVFPPFCSGGGAPKPPIHMRALTAGVGA